MLDDLFTYRLGPERFLTVTNASNHEKDLAWFERHAAGFDVVVTDRIDELAMLAVQGPHARELVSTLAGSELPPRMRAVEMDGLGLVCGTGYTGEDGVEILLAADDAPVLWGRLLDGGATPVGLAARDTLRLEVNYHLYGNDLMESRGPIEAGLGWACKDDTGFVGSDAVRAARQPGPGQPSEQLVAFVMQSGIARQGNAVAGGGEVTSGTMSPSLGVGIGMAYVPIESAVPGSRIEIDVRGKIRTAEVKPKPLYRKDC